MGGDSAHCPGLSGMEAQMTVELMMYLAWEEAHRDQRAVFWIETRNQVFWH